ncbi:heavy-metal-associated domain-containing protein [Fundicoccus sp. Sow4_D5]|uniref:heavy-metal-associated domain-containing protein n=1 Tax=unclassified Fundicoccus TaxID=2761543 RepID=UPI003F920DE1
MKQATIQLEALSCPSCLQKIENAVKGLDGIDKDSVKVMFNASKVKTQFDEEKVSLETINNSIEALGYGVLKSKAKAV